MKKTLLSLVVGLALTGCNNVQDYAREMSKALGVPVTVEQGVADKDACLLKQLSTWQRQYLSFTQEQREQLADRVRGQFGEMALGATTRGAHVRTRRVYVDFGFYDHGFDWGGPWGYPGWGGWRGPGTIPPGWVNFGRKLVVSDSTTTREGEAAGPRRELRSNRLSLRFVASPAEREAKIYRVWRRSHYDAITDGDTLRQYIRYGRARLAYYNTDPGLECGEMVNLEEVIENETFFESF